MTFVSCGKEKDETIEESSSSVSNTLFDLMPSKTELNSQNETNLEYKGKKVKEVKIKSSVGIPINFDTEVLKDLENLKNSESVPDASLDALFGVLIITYDDGTDETVGQVYIGSDKAFYLKFSNSKNKDAAYKLVDRVF